MQHYIHHRLLKEFFAAQFELHQNVFFFHGGTVSEAAMSKLNTALQGLARECVDIMEQDRMVKAAKKQGMAFVLALRPWEYSGFAQFMRE
ncbi:MAG: hypothetical protein ABUL58_06190 [Steroidobacter sp.]